MTEVTAGSRVRADDFDPMQWLDKDSAAGGIIGDTVNSVGKSLKAAAEVRREAYERQMEIDFAQRALTNCSGCSDEAALKARVDGLIENDEKLHRKIDDIAGNTGLAAVTHYLMDPTGQRARRYQKALNFERLIADYCYVASQKDFDKDSYYQKSYSMESLENQASAAWMFCKAAVRTKYGDIQPERFPDPPQPSDPPNEARDFFFTCQQNSTLGITFARKIADVCGLRFEDVRAEPPSSYDLIKTCNPDPGGPMGSLSDITNEARKILFDGGPDADKKAYALTSRMASKHYAPAMYLAGQALLTGKGVEKDEVAAFTLFSQAAARYDEDATVSMAIMYKNGTVVAKDIPTALRHLKYIERRRHEGPAADAAIVLARMYATGDGVPQDNAEAADHYEESVSRQNRHQLEFGHWVLDHPEYNREAGKWLIEHGYISQAMRFLHRDRHMPELQLEAVKWYMSGWTNGDGSVVRPNPAAAKDVLLTYLVNNKDPDVKRQAQQYLTALSASAK